MRETWLDWERLIVDRGIVIDRPKGSAHPRYPAMIYPLDYGHIPGTVGVTAIRSISSLVKPIPG